MTEPLPISVIILTWNEEVNLPDCLDSVSWSDDVVVFDSFSTDKTEEIARGRGARFVQRAFDNYASQRNVALAEVDYKHSWALMLDADERVTPELAEEMKSIFERPDSRVTLYRMRRKDMWMGRWLRRSSGYPTWFGRLMRLGRVRVEREINEEYHTDGEIGVLQEHLVHYPFNKGVAYWFERHNRYSSMEAATSVEELQTRLELGHLFARDPVLRRKAVKQLGYRLPCRPLLAFGYLYFARLGILDGKAGFSYCLLRSIYECMIELKRREFERRDAGLPL